MTAPVVLVLDDVHLLYNRECRDALSVLADHVPGGSRLVLAGAGRLVSEYMESEFLARISQRHRVFLTRTAVLERMSGPLCEAVLELPGSAAALADLNRSNMLLVPLDRRGQWYRYHHLFRDMLLAELERLEPGLMPVLRRRAAGWCLRNDRYLPGIPISCQSHDAQPDRWRLGCHRGGTLSMTAGTISAASRRRIGARGIDGYPCCQPGVGPRQTVSVRRRPYPGI